jgi:GYF domain 2/Interferon-induced transmembrane protein
MKLWNYTKMGLRQGPVPEDELRQKIRRGEISGTTLVWCEGMADWLPLAQVAELQQPVASASVPPATQQASPQFPPPQPHSPPRMLQPLGHVPQAQPPAYHGNYVAPAIPSYLWQSVVATILGLLICWLVAMPFGIVAIVFASKVEGLRVHGDIAGAMSASNSAKTWMIISYAITGLSLLAVIGILLLGAH